MRIELSTKPAPALPHLNVLDVQIMARTKAGKSLLFLQLLLQDKYPDSRLATPPLSWFDAQQLHRFLQQLAAAPHATTSVVNLQDTGIQLTGFVGLPAGRVPEERTIQVAPLGKATSSFAPFTVQMSAADLKTYAGKLYQRLWESFLKG